MIISVKKEVLISLIKVVEPILETTEQNDDVKVVKHFIAYLKHAEHVAPNTSEGLLSKNHTLLFDKLPDKFNRDQLLEYSKGICKRSSADACVRACLKLGLLVRTGNQTYRKH